MCFFDEDNEPQLLQLLSDSELVVIDPLEECRNQEAFGVLVHAIQFDDGVLAGESADELVLILLLAGEEVREHQGVYGSGRGCFPAESLSSSPKVHRPAHHPHAPGHRPRHGHQSQGYGTTTSHSKHQTPNHQVGGTGGIESSGFIWSKIRTVVPLKAWTPVSALCFRRRTLSVWMA